MAGRYPDVTEEGGGVSFGGSMSLGDEDSLFEGFSGGDVGLGEAMMASFSGSSEEPGQFPARGPGDWEVTVRGGAAGPRPGQMPAASWQTPAVPGAGGRMMGLDDEDDDVGDEGVM